MRCTAAGQIEHRLPECAPGGRMPSGSDRSAKGTAAADLRPNGAARPDRRAASVARRPPAPPSPCLVPRRLAQCTPCRACLCTTWAGLKPTLRRGAARETHLLEHSPPRPSCGNDGPSSGRRSLARGTNYTSIRRLAGAAKKPLKRMAGARGCACSAADGWPVGTTRKGARGSCAAPALGHVSVNDLATSKKRRERCSGNPAG